MWTSDSWGTDAKTEAMDADALAPAANFETFFRDEYPRLVRAMVLLTASPAEAEDLAQEALTRAYERWEKVRGLESPLGYVYRTALNLNRKRLRRLAVRARIRLEAHHGGDPATAVEARNEVLRLLAALPSAQREAVVLVEWLGLDADEAGQLIGIAAASVRGRLHRARAVLQKLAGEDDE
jgi:RNA polymerase sigma-70 factor (ECF subfamily)